MKTKLLTMVFFLAGLFLVSCDDDDDKVDNLQVKASFDQKYPNASRVSWEMEGGYLVADFYLDNRESSAWWDAQGKWVLTETDLFYEDLPETVKKAFSSGEYGTWRVDDVDKLERPEKDIVFVLDVELGNQEYDLYYSEAGELLEALKDIV